MGEQYTYVVHRTLKCLRLDTRGDLVATSPLSPLPSVDLLQIVTLNNLPPRPHHRRSNLVVVH